jgi:MFS transporter, UMF1 family
MGAIVASFVFSVYLTQTVGEGTPGGATPASWLGRATAVAGLTVAVLAPVTGAWVQAARWRGGALAVLSGLAVVLTAAMSLIRDDPSYFFVGLALLAVAAVAGDLATVPYNAMLRQVSTPENSGRVSGFGLASGFFGSVLLLLLAYAGFIAGDGPTRGLLGIPTADGQNVRAAMLLAAAWFALWALPLLFTAGHLSPQADDPVEQVGILSAYRKVWADIVEEWHRDRNLVYYLVASAVFRDGLTGVAAFGAVLGVSVYGVSQGDVLIFGVAASVIAAMGAVIGGISDDRIGSKAVIVISLTAMITSGVAMLVLSGPVAFWVCGLMLCLFLGPAASSARTLLLQLSPEGREGVLFGLYTMTGRAATFLAPWLFSLFVDIFDADRAGLAGILAVLVAGLLLMLGVRAPRR